MTKPNKNLPESTGRREHLAEILEMYMNGDSAWKISEALGITKQKVEYTLRSFRADYLGTLAVRGITPRYNHQQAPIDAINQPFFDLLSNPAECLSNEEMLYCALYVGTGNSLTAVEESGLDVGLKINESMTVSIYNKNLLLRSELLKRKKNIQEEIRRLQKEREEYRDATKDRVLNMHLDMIDQLKDEGDPKNRTHIVKLLDQVNKMQGFYSQTLVTGELNADDLLDGMLMAMEEDKENVSQRLLEDVEDEVGLDDL